MAKADAAGEATESTLPKATFAGGETRRKRLRYVPLVVALAALGAVGATTLALGHHGGASGRSVKLAPSAVSATTPRYFDYTMDVDLSELRAPTQVRVEIEDPDGRRVVEDRRRRRGERVRATARAKGNAVTWRVFYDGTLVKTVRSGSDGRSS